jgi:hypothetical protein
MLVVKGLLCRPLRGLVPLVLAYPGLTPGATFCRRFAALQGRKLFFAAAAWGQCPRRTRPIPRTRELTRSRPRRPPGPGAHGRPDLGFPGPEWPHGAVLLVSSGRPLRHSPRLGSHGPTPGGHGPRSGSHGPTPGTRRPRLETHRPTPGGHGPRLGSHGPTPEGHGPTLGNDAGALGSPLGRTPRGREAPQPSLLAHDKSTGNSTYLHRFSCSSYKDVGNPSGEPG